MRIKIMPDPRKEHSALNEASPDYQVETETLHASTLDDTLAMSPWERILANDDMVNFGNMLRTAMEKRNAKPR